MTEFFTGVGLALFLIPFVMVIGVLGLMWRSWWLYPAWGWFVVPLGVPTVSFWHFTALLLLIGTITNRTSTKIDERKENWWSWASVFTWPIIAWAIMRWMR